MPKQYFIYIAANRRNNVFYTGISNDLFRRVSEHKNKSLKGFTSRYNIDKLVYCEAFDTPTEAILREKQIKGGSRQNKIDLIKKNNPDFRNLTEQ